MKRLFIILCGLISLLPVNAQFNIDRMMTSGEMAIHFEDYVLSIQYFNQIISARPHLYRAWQMRAVAKFYLEDYAGAESDATRAISLNPYIDNIYDLRAISRIRQEKFAEAADDYSAAIRNNPSERGYWYNRAVCIMNMGEYDQALAQTDTITRKWSHYAPGYALKADVFLHKSDTTEALKWLKKSLSTDPYDGNTWMACGSINIAKANWTEADSCLTQALRLRPKHTPSYINRALARLNINNLRGAMSDYNTALDLDPNNFLAHYNRGLLLMQLGADNDAISDFDYVIEMEPENAMAIFNRGSLREKTGDLEGAVRDYSKVITQFPNFWTGLERRASCYRRLGMVGKAEMDEFRIFKAQMDKRQGKQTRWSQAKLKEMRRRSDTDPDKYASIVVDDTRQTEDYQSAYRGHVQNRNVSTSLRGYYLVSLTPYSNGLKSYIAFDKDIEQFNKSQTTGPKLFVACGNNGLGSSQANAAFATIDSLTNILYEVIGTDRERDLLMKRAASYTAVQNYPDAISDLDAVITNDNMMGIAYWLRGVCQAMVSNYESSQGQDTHIKAAAALADFTKAIELMQDNAYAYYDRGTLYASIDNTSLAIEDLSKAIQLEPHLAEAYYNRGLVYRTLGNRTAAISDLSRAGELGLFEAYSVMKQIK